MKTNTNQKGSTPLGNKRKPAKRKSLHNSYTGFTIIELIVVIVVIAILIALTLPNLFASQARARDNVRKNDLRNLKTSLETYRSDKNRYPTSEEGLIMLVPTYQSTIPNDPKGTAYTYSSDGQSYTLAADLENNLDPSANVNGFFNLQGVGQ